MRTSLTWSNMSWLVSITQYKCLVPSWSWSVRLQPTRHKLGGICVGLNWLLVSFLSHVNKNIIHSFIHLAAIVFIKAYLPSCTASLRCPLASLYDLVTEARVCEQLVESHYMKVDRLRVGPVSSGLWVWRIISLFYGKCILWQLLLNTFC